MGSQTEFGNREKILTPATTTVDIEIGNHRFFRWNRFFDFSDFAVDKKKNTHKITFMKPSNSTHKYPIQVGPDHSLRTPREFAEFIMRLSDEQVSARTKFHQVDFDDFQLACDGFNFNRFAMRINQDYGDTQSVRELLQEVSQNIRQARSYDEGDFFLAIESTRERVRFPYGSHPLEQAFVRARRRPLTLICPKMPKASVMDVIAATALELQDQQGDKPIVLPVDHLRRLLRQRKLVVGGALRQLVKHKILYEENGVYYRGKAREYRFIGREGIDYERCENAGGERGESSTAVG